MSTSLLTLFLGATYLVVLCVCEPRLPGRSRSLPLTFIPIALTLAYLTARGFLAKSYGLMLLPPACVAALCAYEFWLFRASWNVTLGRDNATSAAPSGDRIHKLESGDSPDS